MFHEIRPLSAVEELNIVENLVRFVLDLPRVYKYYDYNNNALKYFNIVIFFFFFKFPSSVKAMKRLVAVTKKLRESSDIYLNSLAPSLSTRQLLRITKRLDKYPDSDFYRIVNKACLSQYVIVLSKCSNSFHENFLINRFLPQLTKQMLEKTLYSCSIQPIPLNDDGSLIKCSYDDTILTIGNTTVPRYKTDASSKVPNVLFYNLPQVRMKFKKLMNIFFFI